MDTLELRLQAASNPLATPGGVEKLLEAIAAASDGLMPDTVKGPKANKPYSLSNVKQRLTRQRDKMVILSLTHSTDPEVEYSFYFMGGGAPLGLALKIIVPLAYYLEEAQAERRTRQLVSLAGELCRACDPVYGFAHSQSDFSLGTDPHRTSFFAPKQVYEAYWLNIFGASMVEEIGRSRVLSTPAVHREELPGGGVLWLTRPTPADFASSPAREAQAQALSHLRSDLSFKEALTRLQQRSDMLAPVKRDWDPDIQDLLERILDDVSYAQRQQETARFNQYRPPEVTEWRPVSESLPPDVEDVEQSIATYQRVYAENLVMAVHDKTPEGTQIKAEALPFIDYYFWHEGPVRWLERAYLEEKLIPAVGGYLGYLLVRDLNGRWIPRRNLDEAQVVVGERAWLPFLRARHFLESKQAALDYSLTKFYRTARRDAR